MDCKYLSVPLPLGLVKYKELPSYWALGNNIFKKLNFSLFILECFEDEDVSINYKREDRLNNS